MTVRPRYPCERLLARRARDRAARVEVANARNAASRRRARARRIRVLRATGARSLISVTRRRRGASRRRDPRPAARVERRGCGDRVPRGILRFAERSPECGQLDNSHPARFVHVDVSDATAAVFAAQPNPFPAPPRADATATTTSGARCLRRRRTYRWPSAMPGRSSARIWWPPMRSSTRPVRRNGPSRHWLSWAGRAPLVVLP